MTEIRTGAAFGLIITERRADGFSGYWDVLDGGYVGVFIL